jgi:hypothetical protein
VLKVYAMMSWNQKNIDIYIKKGIYKTDNLDVRSFKMYGDGAQEVPVFTVVARMQINMGPYVLPFEMRSVALQIANSEFQPNYMLWDSTTQFC